MKQICYNQQVHNGEKWQLEAKSVSQAPISCLENPKLLAKDHLKTQTMPRHLETKRKRNTVDKADKVKTTPELVKEANESLYHATMNLPNAAKHCGMTEREMKMTFREFLKYQEQ